jgi:hypothetical protein
MTRPRKYSTPYTGDMLQRQREFDEYILCVADCFGAPYDDRERKKTVEELWKKIRVCVEIGRAGKTGVTMDTDNGNFEAGAEADADAALWQTVIVYQKYPFHTSSGLPFFYTVKQGKNGAYTGELVVSRKEGSKTLTRSSVLLAFHKVLESLKIVQVDSDGEENTGSEANTDGETNTGDAVSTVALVPAEYKGPKAIGQIFGISYVYSLFWKWGLIAVPEKIEEKLRGKRSLK